MNPPAASPRDPARDRLLRDLGERLAHVEARQEGSDNWLKEVAGDAKAARQAAERTATILESQNFGDQLKEVRGEARTEVSGLRQDLVAAIGRVRDDHLSLEKRVVALEDLREQGRGASVALKTALDIAKVLVGAGGGALLIKLLGAH